MKRRNYILLVCIAVAVFSMQYSLVRAELPLDDAYYWPGDEPAYVAFPPADSEAQPIEQTDNNVDATLIETDEKRPEPQLEFTNIQDTTITVRITR